MPKLTGLILLFLLWTCLPFATALAGPFKNVRDWSTVCTDSLSCSLQTLNDENRIYAFGFERSPEANSEVIPFLNTGLKINEESEISIRINGAKQKFFLSMQEATLNEGVWRFPGQNKNNQLLDAMIKGNKAIMQLETSDGLKTVPISLSGVAATALFMDEAQGRLNNQDAIYAKGDGEPKSAVTRARELASSRELPRNVYDRWANTGDNCSEGYDENQDLIADYGGLAIAVEKDATLYVIPCGGPGAYNAPHAAIIHDHATDQARILYFPVMGQKGPTVVDYAYNTNWNDKASTLTAYFKGRGYGDCGYSSTWLWEGGYYSNFILIEERAKSDCDGKHDEWPVTWPVQ